MRPAAVLVLILATWAPLAVGTDPPEPEIVVSEVVADPQTDWTQDGRVTASDEFIELHNPTDDAVDLGGWSLWLNDTTPETWALSGFIEPGAWKALVNPPGEINNNGHVALRDPANRTVAEVRYGSWPQSHAPTADANGPANEALRLQDGTWSAGHATPGGAAAGPFFWPPVEGTSAWRGAGPWTNLTLAWRDAGRNYTEATWAWTPDAAGSAEEHWTAPATLADGTWAVSFAPTGNATAGTGTWSVRDGLGVDWPGPRVRVRVDQEPPEPPRVIAPSWARGPGLNVSISASNDTGVGNVTYTLERAAANDSWELLAPWTPTPGATSVAFGDDESILLRARAQDALGNEILGEAHAVRRDDVPPPPADALVATGYRLVRFAWTVAPDNASGLAELRVLRTGGSGNKSWTVDPTVGHVDDNLPLGVAANYSVVPIDAAGNIGETRWIQPAHEGLQPHADRVRVSKPIWGGGILRLHVDFDRRMDTTTDPLVHWAGGGSPTRLTGDWLANATTYTVRLEAPEDFPEGPAAIRVESATDPHGRPLWQAASASVLVDRTPPRLDASDVDGWVNATGIVLGATDLVDAAPSIEVRWNETADWTRQESTITLPPRPNATLEARAVDHAGLRSATIKRALRVDAQAPTFGDLAATCVPVTDAESGIDRTSVGVRDVSGAPILFQWEAASGCLRLNTLPTSAFTVTIKDRVGNVAARSFEGPPVIEPPPNPLAAPGDALPLSALHDPLTTRTSVVDVLTGGGLPIGGLLTVAIGAGVWAHRRAKTREPPSLARRVQALRDTEGVADLAPSGLDVWHRAKAGKRPIQD